VRDFPDPQLYGRYPTLEELKRLDIDQAWWMAFRAMRRLAPLCPPVLTQAPSINGRVDPIFDQALIEQTETVYRACKELDEGVLPTMHAANTSTAFAAVAGYFMGRGGGDGGQLMVSMTVEALPTLARAYEMWFRRTMYAEASPTHEDLYGCLLDCAYIASRIQTLYSYGAFEKERGLSIESASDFSVLPNADYSSAIRQDYMAATGTPRSNPPTGNRDLEWRPLWPIDIPVWWPKLVKDDFPRPTYRGLVLGPHLIQDADHSRPMFGAMLDARALATILADGPGGTIVGLLGPWGRGKSYLITLTDQAIASEHPHCSVVHLSAWRHTSPESIWAYCYSEICAVIRRESGREYYTRLPLLWIERHGPIPVAAIPCIASMTMLVLASFGASTSQTLTVFGLLLGVLAALMGPVANAIPLAKSVADNALPHRRQVSRLGALGEIERDLRSILSVFTDATETPEQRGSRALCMGLGIVGPALLMLFPLIRWWPLGSPVTVLDIVLFSFGLLGVVCWILVLWLPTLRPVSRQRVVVTIDDLDRCRHDEGLSILERLQTLVSEPGIRTRVSVLVATEESALRSSLESRVKDLRDGGNTTKHSRLVDDWIEKLFTCILRLETLPSVDLEHYYHSKTRPKQSGALDVTRRTLSHFEIRRGVFGEQLPMRYPGPTRPIAQAKTRALNVDRDVARYGTDELIALSNFQLSVIGIYSPRQVEKFLTAYRLARATMVMRNFAVDSNALLEALQLCYATLNTTPGNETKRTTSISPSHRFAEHPDRHTYIYYASRVTIHKVDHAAFRGLLWWHD